MLSWLTATYQPSESSGPASGIKPEGTVVVIDTDMNLRPPKFRVAWSCPRSASIARVMLVQLEAEGGWPSSGSILIV